MFERLKEVLNAGNRQYNMDVWRGVAVLSVVLFHFYGFLPYGYIGVDLFFVISGYLVGGMLSRRFLENEPIHFRSFFFRRGLKIWPSYYVFLLIGFVVAQLLFTGDFADQRMDVSELPRYSFWYRNFRGYPIHFVFDHVWSLCIEEHFYILFPLLLLLLSPFRNRTMLLIAALIATIIFSGACKFAMFYLANSKDTYAMTFNRLDAFAWGILAFYLQYTGRTLAGRFAVRIALFIVGTLGVAAAICCDSMKLIPLFKELIMHSILPVFIFLIVWSTFEMKRHRILYPLRVIGYYSYNWYLWHPIIALLIIQYFGYGWPQLLFYCLLSFIVAVFFTRIVEEYFLKIRDRFIRS